MEPKHSRITSRPANRRGASLAAFLAAHLGHIESDDVGPIIGQAAFVSELGLRAVAMPGVHRTGINAALSGSSSARSIHARTASNSDAT